MPGRMPKGGLAETDCAKPRNSRELAENNCEKPKNNREEVVRFGAIRFDFGAIRFDFSAIRFDFSAIRFLLYQLEFPPLARRQYFADLQSNVRIARKNREEPGGAQSRRLSPPTATAMKIETVGVRE